MKVLVSFSLQTDDADWKARYDEHAGAREAAGNREAYVGHESDDPRQVHALYEVDSRAVFDAFLQAPENAAFARASGHRRESTQVVALTWEGKRPGGGGVRGLCSHRPAGWSGG